MFLPASNEKVQIEIFQREEKRDVQEFASFCTILINKLSFYSPNMGERKSL